MKNKGCINTHPKKLLPIILDVSQDDGPSLEGPGIFCEVVSLVHPEIRRWSGTGGPMLWIKPKQVSTHYFKGF